MSASRSRTVLWMVQNRAALALAASMVVALMGLWAAPTEGSTRACNWRLVFDLPPTTVLYNQASEAQSTIKVEIGTGESPSDNDWGGRS